MKSYSFKQCTIDMLEQQFEIEQTYTSKVLDNWMNRQLEVTISDFENKVVESLQQYMQHNILSWNEQELALNFIGPMMSFVRFSAKKYNFFAERLIDAIIKDVNGDEVLLSGKPDTIVASGFRKPQIPYFSFHEHKQEIDSSGDPIGQVLAAMLVGQAKNGKPDDPIYGCYVVGQNWYFLVLEDKFYTIASPLATTNNEIFDVFRMLKAMKGMIEERIG